MCYRGSMRCLSLLLIIFLVSGCSRFSVSDLATGVGAASGATLASAVGAGVPATVALTTVGAVGGAGIVEEKVAESIGEVCSTVPDEMKADCIKDQTIVRAVKAWGLYAIYAALGVFILTFAAGYFLPNGKQRKMHKKLFDSPIMKMDDM